MSEELKKWAEKFDTLDQKHDGKLYIEELKKSIQEDYGCTTVTDSEIADMFSDLDQSGDSMVSKEEFLFAMCKKDRRAAFAEFFDKYDTDGSGTLSLEELTKLCRDIGLPDEKIEKTTEKCDKDCDGKIQKEEFMKNMP